MHCKNGVLHYLLIYTNNHTPLGSTKTSTQVLKNTMKDTKIVGNDFYYPKLGGSGEGRGGGLVFPAEPHLLPPQYT